MNNDQILKVFNVVVCLVLSATGIFFLVNPLNKEMKENVRENLESPTIGPFDDAMADMVGMPRKTAPEPVIPEFEPVEYNFDFSNGY